MGRNMVEGVMGAVVLVVAAMFVYFAYNTSSAKVEAGYPVSANFLKVGGLTKGSDVRISGIKVGIVTAERLDPKTFEAVIVMSIAEAIKLPADSVASIASDGVLGGKYVRIEPGIQKTFIANGGAIAKTKDYRSLEDQVGDIIFLATGGDDGGKK